MARPSDPSRPRSRQPEFTTLSGVSLDPVYRPTHLADFDYARDLGDPGAAPYTRGIHPSGYQGRLWTIRQFSGFATPEQTNERYRHLLEQGQTGLSVAFDLPTLMGLDSDDEAAAGEVGKCGVAVDSVEDMETIFHGIRLDQVSTSMTINAPAAAIWAMYLVAAERQGSKWTALAGTLQNDILKEYIAQKEFIYPPAAAMRLVVDTIQFAADHTPRFNPVSISGYHIREAGSTALQELAFTLRDGFEYVDWTLRRGLPVDAFAPRLSFFFNAHSDFFEEIAKFRAARKLWSEAMTSRYGARDPSSAKLRFHAQTAGVSLTAQQPYNNLARVAWQGLAAVLGGCQSLHTNAMDEALALPTAEAATLALRTQQVLAFESGVTESVDPLGGSYFLERLTLDMETEARAIFARIDALGGMVAAVEQRYPQREIAESSYRYQQAVERGDKTVVGVNVNRSESEDSAPPTLAIDEHPRQRQAAKLRALRALRSNATVTSRLDALRLSAENGTNTMPALLDCVRAEATLGEITRALRDVLGDYQEEPAI